LCHGTILLTSTLLISIHHVLHMISFLSRPDPSLYALTTSNIPYSAFPSFLLNILSEVEIPHRHGAHAILRRDGLNATYGCCSLIDYDFACWNAFS